MNHPRNSTALRQLADLGREPDPPRWAWAVVQPDPSGRIRLLRQTRDLLGAVTGQRHAVRGACGPLALVVRADGPGAHLRIDPRGRLLLPTWMRRHAALVVGADLASATVVIAPVSVLDGVGTILAGAGR